jgi:hypothetical protein
MPLLWPLDESPPPLSPISKDPWNRLKTLGRLSSTLSASLLTIFLSNLAFPSRPLRILLTLLINIALTKRHRSRSQSNPRPCLGHYPRSLHKRLPHVPHPRRLPLPLDGTCKRRSILWVRKSVPLFHTCLRPKLSEIRKVRQVRAGAGRDTKVVATVAQDPRSKHKPVPCKQQ